MMRHNRTGKHSREAGMTMIELLFAGFVLVIGFMGSLILIFIAIASNSRNKTDTTATMLSQLVIEQINVMPTNSGVPSIPVSDCITPNHTAATTWDISITGGGGAGSSAGATLVNDTSNPLHGTIDFTQKYADVPTGYKMEYYTCGDVTYDVRWHVKQVTGLTRLIIVSARQKGASNNIQLFSPPVTLRTISGP